MRSPRTQRPCEHATATTVRPGSLPKAFAIAARAVETWHCPEWTSTSAREAGTPSPAVDKRNEVSPASTPL
ncbi:hypothetical protein [Amycolatopsis sp. lyj-84]|uniref:hypothetical protein n=1 Tax=Amycolatopsis sp. lyj-84 TaxID=2789284 RepID=UPI00397B66C4